MLDCRCRSFCGCSAVGRVTRICEAYELPVAIPPHLSLSKLMDAMAVDKKNEGVSFKNAIFFITGSLCAALRMRVFHCMRRWCHQNGCAQRCWDSVGTACNRCFRGSHQENHLSQHGHKHCLESKQSCAPSGVMLHSLPASFLFGQRQPITGSVKPPGSKSISNRVLLLSALSCGTVVLKGLLQVRALFRFFGLS